MFRPVEMIKVNLLILDKHLAAVTEALGALGLVHLVDAAPQSADRLLAGLDRTTEIAELERLDQRCTALAEILAASDHAAAETTALAATVPATTPAAWHARIEAIQAGVGAEHDAIAHLLEESGLLVQRAAVLTATAVQTIPLERLRALEHFHVIVGRLSPIALAELHTELAERAAILHEAERGRAEERVLVLCARKNRWAVDSALGKAGFKPDPLPEHGAASATEERCRAESRLEAVRLELERHRQALAALGARHEPEIRQIGQRVRRALDVARAQQHFGSAAELRCISGWIPRHTEAPIRAMVARVTGNTGVLEATLPAEDEHVRSGRERVPILFKRHLLLSPFQGLVSTFGAPRYQEVEPSLFVALSFVLMFGFMFGDVGQGLVVALAGVALRRTRRPALRRWRDAGSLLILCGMAATVFGFLFGSVFGNENLLPVLWLHPLRDVMRLFAVAVGFGIVCISVGVGINIANHLRARRFLDAVFDKFGVLGLLFYWGGLWIGLGAARTGTLSARQVALVVVLPLALIFVREPLGNVLRRRRKLIHEDIVTFVLESGIEILETVTAFLGSTVSFIRVGAFALSHTALCLAVYAVADIVRPLPGGWLWALLIIVLGNLLVIVLEGMVVTIQGIRLEYYELFSKYFSGDGVMYEPFTLVQSEQQQERTET